MRIWIDNTGLHTAARCLEGRASPSHEYEIRSLLQLATLVIFGTKITLNGFEDESLAQRSREMLRTLSGYGISEDIISIQPTTEAEYALACKTATESSISDLEETFNPAEYELLGVAPPEAPRALHDRQMSYISLVDEPACSPRLRRAENSALMSKAPGAVEYMIASSQRLRDAVKRVRQRHPHWDKMQSYQLNIFLRYHLNEALAEQSFSKYAPAVGRAELIQRRAQYLLDAIGRTTDRAVEDLRGDSLGIPSTLAALLQRSKGEPSAVLSVAREFREHSFNLRRSLEKLADTYPEDTAESRFEIRRELAELSQDLRREIGLEKSSTLRSALEIKLVVGLPVVSVSVGKILDWLRERKRARRVAVLTEIVKASAYSDSSDLFYQKLCDQSRQNHS